MSLQLCATKRMFTCDLYSDEIKYILFCVWSIFILSFHEIPQNQTHFRCYLFAVFLKKNEISFKMITLPRNEIIQKETY